jgi:hypothetical protein
LAKIKRGRSAIAHRRRDKARVELEDAVLPSIVRANQRQKIFHDEPE